jgi:hypothetical protein
MDNEMTTKNFSVNDIVKKIKELSIAQKLIIVFIILAIIGVIVALVSLGHNEGKSPKHAMETDYLYMYNNFNQYKGKWVKFAGEIEEVLGEKNGEAQFLTIARGFDDPQKCIHITLKKPINLKEQEIGNGTYILVTAEVYKLSPAFSDNAFSGEVDA